MIASTWPNLSASAMQALRFAAAAARERAATPTPDTQLDSFDLLIGIMLSHPGTSEAERTFHHFDLVAGQALPSDYPVLSFEGLQTRLAELPPDSALATSQDVDQILQIAPSLAREVPTDAQAGLNSGAVAPLRAVWVALLTTSNPASTAIRDLLERRGISSSGFVSALQAWLEKNDPDYESFLQGYSAAPVDVVNYKADQTTYHAASGTPDAVDDYAEPTRADRSGRAPLPFSAGRARHRGPERTQGAIGTRHPGAIKAPRGRTRILDHAESC